MSATALHALVDNALVTAIPLTEFATSAHVVQVSSTTPASDQGDGSLWYDTTLGILRHKNANARWDCQYAGPQYRNSSGATIPKGAWVTIGVAGDGTIGVCATGGWPDVLGCLTATLVDNASGIVRTMGLGESLIVGPCTAGDVLISAGHGVFAFADGYARSIVATGGTTVTLGIGLAIALGAVASGTTGRVTCMIWG